MKLRWLVLFSALCLAAGGAAYSGDDDEQDEALEIDGTIAAVAPSATPPSVTIARGTVAVTLKVLSSTELSTGTAPAR